MTSLKNTLEDIVIHEAKTQIEALGKGSEADVNLNEVAAYALNRLPPMYASTDRGWLQQRKRAHGELTQQIASVVRQARLSVRRDPLRKPEPLPEDELESPAYVLARLRYLLGKTKLHWRDVPIAVEEVLDDYRGGGNLHNIYSYANRKEIKDLKAYLNRTKLHSDAQKNGGKRVLQLNNENISQIDLEEQEFESYMLTTSCILTNVLEKLVLQVVQVQILRLDTLMPRKVRLEDAAAYTLNRLPAMYATSAQGLEQQRQRVKVELANEIESKVVEALLTLSKTPKRLVAPLPLMKFDNEQEKALTELRLMLRRDDITWQNLCGLLEEALEKAAYEGSNWRERWQLIGQIYKALQLQPGDADLALNYTTQGEILVMKTHSRSVFGKLVDNPRNLAKSVLQFLPSIVSIEIRSTMLTFPLTYTRLEMYEDGVFG